MPQLPPELRLIILSYLDVKNLIKCRLISQTFKEIVDGYPSNQYRINLAICGMRDGSGPRHRPARARLNELEAQQRAWQTLSPRLIKKLKIPYPCVTYQLNCDIFTLGDPEYTSHSIDLLEMPSVISSRPEHRWDVLELGFVATDYVLDLDQDLLLAVDNLSDDCRFHVRTASTGSPHPLAAQPLLIYSRIADFLEHSCFITVCGAIFGAALCADATTGSEFVIFNWITGQELQSFSKADKLRSFILLSENALVFPNARLGCLEVWEIKHDRDEHRDPHPPQFCSLSCAAILSLPELSPDHAYGHISEYTQPARCLFPSTSPHPSRRNTPFCSLDAGEIIAVSISIFHYQKSRRSFQRAHIRSTRHALYIRRPNLHSHFADRIGCTSPLDIPWEKWGPGACRWFQDDSSSRVSGSIFGSRVASLVPGYKTSTLRAIRVLDFNIIPYMTQEGSGEMGSTSCYRTVVIGPTIIPGSGIFKNEVVTELPYCELISKELYSWDDLMLDDEKILGLKENRDGGLVKLTALIM